ncbi:hypothetical protein [uncultured Kordia sp.]|uniref:hypothetical protein n=1 Tax=uncultured Kordia sp. TaxID=507699 RepID=UPI00260EBBD8|nr:hypothetical protein [uncultured Kordia sp.]
MNILKQTLLCICLFTITFAFSQEEEIIPAKNIDLSAFIKDAQIMSKEKDAFKMVWWIPSKYWRLSLEDSNIVDSDRAYIDEMIDSFGKFTLVCIINTEINAYGSLDKKESTVRIKDQKGTIYKPLDDSLVPEDFKMTLSIMKPMISQMLGQFGEQLEFHVFPKKAKDGTLIANPLSKGKFTVLLNKKEFDFMLPLSSMVEKKVCPEDDKLFNGTWNFCPIHGKKLKLQTK